MNRRFFFASALSSATRIALPTKALACTTNGISYSYTPANHNSAANLLIIGEITAAAVLSDNFHVFNLSEYKANSDIASIPSNHGLKSGFSGAIASGKVKTLAKLSLLVNKIAWVITDSADLTAINNLSSNVPLLLIFLNPQNLPLAVEQSIKGLPKGSDLFVCVNEDELNLAPGKPLTVRLSQFFSGQAVS